MSEKKDTAEQAEFRSYCRRWIEDNRPPPPPFRLPEHAIEPEKALLFARMAKASAADTAAFCSSRSVQLHGGIGFTWECDVQIWFKRQKHSQQLFGDGVYQRAKIAELF